MDVALAAATQKLSDATAEYTKLNDAKPALAAKAVETAAALVTFLEYDATALKKVLTDDVTRLEGLATAATAKVKAGAVDIAAAEAEVTKNNLKIDNNVAYLALSSSA